MVIFHFYRMKDIQLLFMEKIMFIIRLVTR